MKSHRKISSAPLAFLSLALVITAFYNMRSDLLIAWNSEEYGHGMLIPFIALLMGCHILIRHPQTPTPSWFGSCLLIGSGLLLTIASHAAFQAAAHYGFILALIALSLSFLGRSITWQLLPAFAYVFFAVPLPHLIYANLSQDLQLFSSTMGVMLLQILGISVYQEGNIIDLGTYKLQVVEACSGLRYLFPLLSFGYLSAYLMQDKLWKRLIVFLSAIPITIGMNTLRITIIGITVDLWGPAMAEGVLHQLEGWVIFTLCAGLLLLEAHWLMRNTGHFRFDLFTLPQGRMLKSPPPRTAHSWSALTIAAILAFTTSGLIEKRQEIIPNHPSFATFPETIGNWSATQQNINSDILSSLQLSDYWLADYTDKTNPTSPINLYIAYYATQRIGASTHSPSHCIPGGGWQVESKSLLPITLENGQIITVTRMLIRRAGVGQLVYYWFNERGRIISETTFAKWYLLLDSIQLGRSDGALIRLVTPMSKGEDAEKADARLQTFLNQLQPSLEQFIPGRDLTIPQESQHP